MGGTTQYLVRGFAWLVGLLLIYTGLLHFANSYGFLASILRYRLTELEMSKFLAMVLPIAHVVVGVFLLTNTFFRECMILAASLFALYCFAQVSALARGLSIDCGCYGFDHHVVSWFSAAQVGLLAVFSWMTVYTYCCRQNK